MTLRGHSLFHALVIKTRECREIIKFELISHYMKPKAKHDGKSAERTMNDLMKH